jgi:exodeoxyribonuclease-1
VVAPINTLTPELAARWGIHWQEVEQHRQTLLETASPLTARLLEVYKKPPEQQALDADLALYTGFIPQKDRELCTLVRQKGPEQLAEWEPGFTDSRLRTLYFRYRARNWPEHLSPKEQETWAIFCQERILWGRFGNTLTLEKYQNILEELAHKGTAERHPEIFRHLVEWVQNA